MKKYLALILALLMLVMCFTACDNSKTESKDPTDNSTDNSEDNSNGDEETRYTAKVPDVKYDGDEFIIVVSYASDSPKRPEYGGAADDELVEDVVNTAIATRNSIVEEKLNIDIIEQKVLDSDRWGAGTVYTKVATALSSGALDFHMVSPSLFNSAALAQNQYLEDMMELEYLHGLSEPWWYQYFTSGVSLYGRVYYASGDISFYNFNATAAILFNKELFKQYDIESPYQLVKDKKWTLDKLREIQTVGFSAEIEVDGVIDYKDQVAIVSSNDMIWAQFYSCGGHIISKDSDGKPYLSLWSETNNNYIEKILTIMQDKNNIIRADQYFGIVQWPGELTTETFTTGRALMNITSIATIDDTAAMEQEFGILPYPLYDENQADYYSFLNPWVGNSACIPFGHDDDTLEFISIVMEMMGAEGKNEITPQFYEVALKRQKTRDDDSQDMLDIISATVGVDIGQNASLADYPKMLHELIELDPGSFFAKYQERQAKAESELETIINAYNS